MSFELNDEQRMLQDQVHALLSEHSKPALLRKVITDKKPWDENLWRQLAALGVLGAGVPEELGGVGLGPVEVGIVAREIGRAVAPVPFISSICLAAEALMIAGTSKQKARWLPRLANGEAVGALAWTEGRSAPCLELLEATLANGKLNGVKSPVADAVIADFAIVAVRTGGSTGLALVELDQAGIDRTPLKSIDQLRHFSRLEFKEVNAEPMDAVDGPTALRRLLDRAAVFGAFEQLGGAEGALFMARDYTLRRYIFGRQLASYQAVKHSLANIFARLELATCNALYAAKGLSEGYPDSSAAAATARLGATEVYESVARENLQFHGGVGFTLEADCHFHYRRARTLALNMGSIEVWSDRLLEALSDASTEVARAGRSTSADATPAESLEDAEYRGKVRAWIAEHGANFRGAGQSEGSAAQSAKAWVQAKHAAGFAAITQPKELGGAGGTRRQQQIFAQEEARLKLPVVSSGAGGSQALAAISRHGTPEQRRKWEFLTHSGQIAWCQLFSEPGAGSDLAAVRTRAIKQNDKWIISGQKVWTSGGHLADYGILLARTDPSLPKHQGLSFFIIDMRQPGVETRPIRQINGQSGFTETFLTDAVALDENRLGAVGEGWAVAMSVLAVERTTTGGIAEGERRTSSTSARSLIGLAKAARRPHGTALDSSAVRMKIAQFHVEAQGIKNFTQRMVQQMSRGGAPPNNLPVIKLTATNRIQRVQAFLMDLDEAGGIVDDPGAASGQDRFMEYLTSASSRIAGGADEVLRNQLAERALGMPGDTRADKDIPFNQIPT